MQTNQTMAGKISFSKRELKEMGLACMLQAVNQQVPVDIRDYITSFKEVLKFDRPIPITVSKTADKGVSKTADKAYRWQKEIFAAQDGANNTSITGKNQLHNNNASLSNNGNQGGAVREKKLTRQEQIALFEKELEEHRKKNDKNANSETAVVYRYHDEGDELMKELEEEEKKKTGKKINISNLFGGSNSKSSGGNTAEANAQILQLNELESSNGTPGIFLGGNENQQMQNAVKPKVEDWLSDIFDKSVSTGGSSVDTFFDLALKDPIDRGTFSTKSKSSRFSALLGISPTTSPDGKSGNYRGKPHIEDDDDIPLNLSSLGNIFGSSNLSTNTKVDLQSLFANACSDTSGANYKNNQFISDSDVAVIKSEDVLSKLGFSGASPPRGQVRTSTDLESPAPNGNDVSNTPTSNSTNQNSSPFAFHGANNDSSSSLNKKKVRAVPVMSAASRMQLNKIKAIKK